MTTAKLVKSNILKLWKVDFIELMNESSEIHLICIELANIFGARKASRMLTVDRDLLNDCLNELSVF